MGPLVDVSLADIDTTFATNVRSAAIPHFGRGGRIIAIGSNAAERGAFAAVVSFLASQVTGAAVLVDGGYNA